MGGVIEEANEASPDPVVLREPHLGERVKHLFGIHTWQPADGPGMTHEMCVGCHQERNGVSRYRPPVDFPSQSTPPETTPTQSARPEDDSAPFQFQSREETRESSRPRPKTGRTQGDFEAAWHWVVGLRLWVKIMGGFIALQLIGMVVSLFTRG